MMNPEVVSQQQDAGVELMSMEHLSHAAECLKVLAHPVRLRIVDLLLQGHFPVGEIAQRCAIRSSQASEHLRLMQSHGLLRSSRVHRKVYYEVAAPHVPKIIACIRENATYCANER